MEKFRMRKSSSRDSSPSCKVVSSIGRSSEEKPIPPDRAHKGREEPMKEHSITKSGSKSNSSSWRTCNIAEDDLLTLQLGKHTSGLLTGTVMKKLLEEEMLRENESRRKPGVIARLMGLDGFPPPQQDPSNYKKRILDNYCLKTASTTTHKNGKLYGGQSDVRSSKGQSEFKDVYQVEESSKVNGDGLPFQASSCRKSCQDEIAIGREKYIDVKKLSSYERFRDTKEFNDALEVFDSNKELLLKFLDQPDTFISKHLHYPHALHDGHEYHWGHNRDMESSALKHNINAIGCQSGWEASKKIDVSFSDKYQDGLHLRSSGKYHRNAQELSHFPVERKEDTSSIPRKIVVLKPNLVKVQNGSKHTSWETLSDFGACKQKDSRNGDNEFQDKRRSPDGLDMSGIHCREYKKLATEITWQLKQKLGKGPLKMSWNGYKAYSADESSLDLSENDSSYESDSNNVISKMPLHWRQHDEVSGSRYSGSSVSREANKRLSERWKMICKSHESKLSCTAGTLGEMLAVPELDISLTNNEAASAYGGSCRCRRGDGMAGSMTPLGVSSKNGWTDHSIERLSRSRSLPASSDYACSPKTSLRHEGFVSERFSSPKEHKRHCRNKTIRRSSSVRTNNMRSGPVYYQDRRVSKVVEFQSDMNEKDISFGDYNSLDVKAVISETPSLIMGEVMDLEPGSFPESFISTDENITVPELHVDTLVHNESCSVILHESMAKEPPMMCEIEDTVSVHCPAEPELQETVNEADQPGPNSILKATFTEDLSSGSECFKRVHTELHGLRMQLQLLKLESQDLVTSSDDYLGEGSCRTPESRGLLEDEGSWTSSYFLDVLAESGFDEMDPEMLEGTWHSVGYLVAPSIFERLEKKYSCLETCSRVERRLVFDSINYAVTEIMEQVTDPHPWIDVQNRVARALWDKERFKAEMCELLKQQESVEIDNAFYQVLESGCKWMDMGDEIDGVGMEIEKKLIDELVADFLTTYGLLCLCSLRYVNCLNKVEVAL